MSDTQSTSNSRFGPAVAPEELVTQNILNQISGVASQYANAMYSWGQGVFNGLQGNINGIMGNLETSAQTAMSGANTALGQFTNSFIPDYQNLRVQGQQWASPAREARNAGMAESDQMQAGQQAIEQIRQRLQGQGVDPGSLRSSGELLAAETAAAAGAAGAGNQSIRADEQTGLGLQKQALDYGIQLPAISANFLNQANQARSIAGNLDIGTANAGTGLAQIPNAYLNTAMQNKYPPSGQSGGTAQQSTSHPAPKSSPSQNQNSPSGPYGPGGPGTNQASGSGSPLMVPNKYFQAGNPGTSDSVVNDARFTDYSAQNNYAFGGQTDPLASLYSGSDTSGNYYNQGATDTGGVYNTQASLPSGDAGTGWDTGPNTTYDQTTANDQAFNQPSTDYSQGFDQSAWDTSYANDMSNYDTGYSGDSGGDAGGFAQGGAIPENGPTTGGAIPQSASPSMGAKTDDIHASVNADEFIMPRDVAIWKGQEFFYKLIADSRAKLAQAQQSGVGGKPSAPPTGPVNFQSKPMG